MVCIHCLNLREPTATFLPYHVRIRQWLGVHIRISRACLITSRAHVIHITCPCEKKDLFSLPWTKTTKSCAVLCIIIILIIIIHRKLRLIWKQLNQILKQIYIGANLTKYSFLLHVFLLYVFNHLNCKKHRDINTPCQRWHWEYLPVLPALSLQQLTHRQQTNNMHITA